MKTRLLTLATISVMSSGIANAHIIEVGKPLPNVNVSEGGIAMITGGDIEYQEWSTDSITDGIVIAQAARPVVQEMLTEDFMSKVKKMGGYVIINADDAPFGAGMFIEKSISEGKLAIPKGNSIMDDDGEVLATWELEEESVAVIVVKNSKVAYISEGALTANQESEILGMVK